MTFLVGGCSAFVYLEADGDGHPMSIHLSISLRDIDEDIIIDHKRVVPSGFDLQKQSSMYFFIFFLLYQHTFAFASALSACLQVQPP